MAESICRSATIVLVRMLGMLLPARAADPIGTWLTQLGEAHIRVAKCGNALCGTVAWLRDEVDAEGQPTTDSKNPDPSKRNRKIMEPEPGGQAWAGDIYNSDDGLIYKGRIVPRGDDEMEVQGCNAKKMCGFEIWSRVKHDPDRGSAH